jgi:hypothetical protein
MAGDLGHAELRIALGGWRRCFGPGQVAVLFEPGVEVKHGRGGAKAVVGSQHRRGIRTRQRDDLPDQLVELAKVVFTERPNLQIPFGRRVAEASGVNKSPAKMLQLVDAIEKDANEI